MFNIRMSQKNPNRIWVTDGNEPSEFSREEKKNTRTHGKLEIKTYIKAMNEKQGKKKLQQNPNSRNGNGVEKNREGGEKRKIQSLYENQKSKIAHAYNPVKLRIASYDLRFAIRRACIF